MRRPERYHRSGPRTNRTLGATALDDPTAQRPASAPGLREQAAATREALLRVLRAHTDLARAELSDILDEVKRVAILGGLALGCGLPVLLLAPAGVLLFLGEWLFGSIGWGVLLGSEALLALAVVLGVLAAGFSARSAAFDLLAATVAGILVAAVFAANLTNQAWLRLGDAIAGNVAVEWRVIVVALGSCAIVLGVLLALVGLARSGFGGLVGGLVLGALAGLAIGGLTAISYSLEVAAALGVCVGLAVWPALVGLGLARQGIDQEQLKARLWPQQSIDTTKETIEWVRARTPLGRRP